MYTRKFNEEKGNFHCFRKNFQHDNYIETQDFLKNDNNSKVNFKPKPHEMQEKMFKVLSAQTIEKGEMFIKALLRFLESKYSRVLY